MILWFLVMNSKRCNGAVKFLGLHFLGLLNNRVLGPVFSRDQWLGLAM